MPTHVKVGGFLQFSGLQHYLNDAPLPDANHPDNVTEIFIIIEDVVGYSDRSGKLRTESLGARFAGTGVFFTVPVVR